MLGNVKMIATMLTAHLQTSRKIKKCKQSQDRKKVYELLKYICKRMIKSAKMQIVITGKENLPLKGPVLYVANHKSLFDTVTLVHVIDEPVIFIGKKEVANMPLIGKWFDALGCIYIDREDIRQSLKAIMKGIEELKQGQSIVIFPEGTRSSGKGLNTFKEGSFKLAIKAKVPIIPIALYDTQKVFEEKRKICKATVYMNVGEPIYIEKLTNDQKTKIGNYVEQTVERLLEEIENNRI